MIDNRWRTEAWQRKAFGPWAAREIGAQSGLLSVFNQQGSSRMLREVEDAKGAAEVAREAAHEAAAEAADEAAKEAAEEAAKEAAEEAYKEAYEEAYNEAYEEAFKEDLSCRPSPQCQRWRHRTEHILNDIGAF
jgi:flagellar biosynthesis/type III secretory pathway protein FliH